MLTEGWTPKFSFMSSVRAFGTQLLCEQVVGRALRRMSYAVNDKGHFDAEYAEIYGVPFSFIPTSGSNPDPKTAPYPYPCAITEERVACEITFPRLAGYRYYIPGERLESSFHRGLQACASSTADIPTKVQVDPIVGETSIYTLDDLKRRRENEVAFLLAKLTLEKYFRRGWQWPAVAPLPAASRYRQALAR